jgi:hypothetical protein
MIDPWLFYALWIIFGLVVMFLGCFVWAMGGKDDWRWLKLSYHKIRFRLFQRRLRRRM